MTAAPASTNTSTSRRGLPCEREDGAPLVSDSEEEAEEDEEEAGSARRSGEAAGACCESSTKCCWLWTPPAAAALTVPLADSWRVRERTSPDGKAGNGAIERKVAADRGVYRRMLGARLRRRRAGATYTDSRQYVLDRLRTRSKRAVRGRHLPARGVSSRQARTEQRLLRLCSLTLRLPA